MALWICLAPILGGIQAVASFVYSMLQFKDLGNSDLHHILMGLALVYGGGWFIPALIISDILFLRRTLSTLELVRYILAVGATAALVGLFTQGVLLMIGYPVTAAAILVCGFLHRQK